MATRVSFHESLDLLWVEMADMAARNTTAIERATLALFDSNRQLAELVLTERVDGVKSQEDVEQRAINLIALQQPVASDLRLVTSSIPMSSALARMGDLAAHVARTTRLRAPESAIPPEVRGVFEQIGQAAIGTSQELHAALTDRDVDRATAVTTSDVTMDGLRRELFTSLLEPGWTRGIEAAVDVTLLGRFYERFADHAVAIAGQVCYLTTGRIPQPHA